MRTRLVVFISVVQGILFLAHWFVYATVSFFWGGAASSWEMKLAFFLLSISFVLASLRGWYSFHPAVRIFYSASALWLGFASFFLLASIACWVVEGVNRLLALGWQRIWIANIAFALAALAAILGLLNAMWPRISRITIALPGLPLSWRSRTAVLVSDLHLGHLRSSRFVRRIVSTIAALRPDVAFIAGDLYDGVAGDFEKLAQPWTRLTAGPEALSRGVFCIAGNHEEFYRNDEYRPPLLRSGVRVLDNEKVELDDLQLVGVHYRDAVHAERYRAILQRLRLDQERPSVLLLHAPVCLPISEEEGISLQLSGHTHGGQFFPWNLITRRVWGRFVHGLQKYGRMQVYTTYGAGTWGPPFRLGTTPEIVHITFA